MPRAEEDLVTHVVVTWGDDYPLCAMQQPRGEALALGGPGGVLGSHAAQPWVRIDAEGRLRVPRDALVRWTARAGAAPLPLPSRQDEPAWIALQEGDRLCLSHEGLCVHLEVAEPERRRWHGLVSQRWERGALWAMAGSLTIHGLFLVMGWLLPPTASALSLDLAGEDLARARYLVTPNEPPPPPPNWLAGQEDGGGEAAPAPEAEGAAGEHEAPPVPRRRTAPRGERRSEPPDAAHVSQTGILGELAVLSGPSGPSAFDPTSLDPHAKAHMGALFGEQVGAGFGIGGLGLRDEGRGGGGKPLGTRQAGILGTRGGRGVGPGVAGPVGMGRPGKAPPRMRGKAEVKGSLSKEAIRRRIRRHTNEVRHCYERGLRVRPDLAGRVRVFFLIQPDGSVGSAAVRESDLGDPGVETCLARAVRRWSFPRPQNGGMVQVTYPFLLQTSP